MAEVKSTIYRDMLDIIFANRNKAYGAYQLRRDYPKYLGRALGIGLLLIALFFAVPAILSAVQGIIPEKPVDVVAELGPPPDIDPSEPPPPPPPPPPTPPPPVRATVAFVPPIMDKDENVTEEPPPPAQADITVEVAAKTQEGTADAPIAEFEAPPAAVEAAPPPEPEKTYEMFDIQKPPSFPGGDAERQKFLAENIKYPALARENNIQGNVVLSFVVGKDGSVSDIQILKDIGGGCGKEAIRVVQAMPKWSPGEANGHPVKVKFTLPVRFRLE